MDKNNFSDNEVRLDVLKQRAYNLRWATVKEGIIPLTAADPDFPCAPQIAEGLQKFIRDRYLCYGPPEGLPEFKQSLSEFFNERRNVKAQSEYILPVDSAAFGIYITCEAFLQKGDQAIIFDPVDFLFKYSIEKVGGEAIAFPIKPGEKEIDFNLLESLITKKTKMICVCNPINPTGKVLSRIELQNFAKVAEKYNLIILSDEIWSDIIYKPFAFTSIGSLNDDTFSRTITITGFSKSYGLAGLRIGAVVSPNNFYFKKIMEVSLHHSTIHGANILGQVAGHIALTECNGWLNDFVNHLEKMRTLIFKRIINIKGFSCYNPEGTYVFFIDIKGTGMDSERSADLILKKAKVSVVPGLAKWFGNGAEGYIRISFATSEGILNEAFNRIEGIFN